MADPHQSQYEYFRMIRHNLPQMLLLLVTVLAVYGEVLSHSFLVNWDDPAYVTQNPAIRGFSLENLKLAFSSYFVGNYAPIQIVSYMLDYTLWGGNPFGYLLANLFYHYLSGILLYCLLLRGGFLPWAAFLGTAVFLVHPVQVESVAWVSQRKNLLAMLFCLAAFHGYLNYREVKGRPLGWYRLSVGLFVLALLAKSVAVIFPLMLILYDLLITPVRRQFGAQRDKLPYLAATIVVAMVALVSQDVEHGGGRVDYPANPLLVMPLTMLPVLTSYVRLLLLPVPSQLSVMYFPPLRDSIDAAVAVALVLVAVLIAGGVYLYRNDRSCLFWYLLFFVGLLPVSQIVPLITQMNDRYLYFPMLGIAGVVACGGETFWIRCTQIRLRRWGVMTAACLLIALAVLSYQRGKVWRNSVFLFSDLVAKYPAESASWARLAEGYIAEGDISLAQHYYEKASSLGPLDNDGIYNLVQIYFEKRMNAHAFAQIELLLRNEDQANRGQLLLGEYHYRTGNFAKAEEVLRQFLAGSPRSAHGLYLLGQICLITGRPGQAGESYQKALEAGGDHSGLFFSIACTELREGRPARATAALQAAFARGLAGKDLQGPDICLQEMLAEPGLAAMIRQQTGK